MVIVREKLGLEGVNGVLEGRYALKSLYSIDAIQLLAAVEK